MTKNTKKSKAKPAPKSSGKTVKKTGKTMQTDVLIVGGGLAGLTLAGVLGTAGVRTIVVDRDPPAAQLSTVYDGRTTAISFASHQVLQAAGMWQNILKDCAPILDIRVADGDAPGFLHFCADADGNGAPFGWIIENRLLRKALFENVQQFDTVTHLAPAAAVSFFENDKNAGVVLDNGIRIEAALRIGADGRQSATRDHLGIDVKAWSYDQTAIVCNVVHALDHESVAVEHFLPAGPFAILPMTDDDAGQHRSSVVWTVDTEDAADLLAQTPADFDAGLQDLFGPHLGAVRHVSKPMGYPLQLLHADRYTGPRTVLMAEAGHVVHPIAGQGLNVSMRDVAVIAELVVDRLRLGLDCGADSVLARYEQLRRTDVLLMAAFTDGLNRLFSTDSAPVAAVRDFGLGIVEKNAFLKGFFARQAMGLGGESPRIIRDGRV